MATEVSPPTRWLADQWENNCGYSSAVLSGIVPDVRHKDNGGYHCSISDLAAFGNAGDYSNRRALDKAPPVTTAGKRYGAAVDMSMSRADMAKLYGRAKRVYDDRADPRRKYLNAINVWDGIDGHSPRRLDFQANTNSTASADHTWHSHEDQPRAYVDVHRNEAEAWTAARAFISMVKGETPAQWLTSIGQGDDMTPEEHDWLKTVHRNLTVLDGRNPVGQIYTRMALGEDHVDPTFVVRHPTLKSLAAQTADAQAKELARDAETAARDAAQTKLIETVLAASGKPMTDEQFATALAGMRQAAAEAGAAAASRLSAQLAAAAQAEADALATPPAAS